MWGSCLQTIMCPSVCDEVEDEFNSKNSKIMVVWKREGGTSWKIGEEILEEVEEFKYLCVWFDRKLRCNVHLEKMASKAEEWVGKVIWMSRVNRQLEIDRQRVVWELIGIPSVEHAAEVWWSGRRSACRNAGVGPDESG